MSANPGGRPRIPEELRDIQPYSVEEVRRLIAKTGRMDAETARVATVNACTSAFERALIKCWQLAADKGDANRLDFLLTRSIGRAPMAEALEDTPEPTRLTPEARDMLVAALKAANGAA